jgi:hypothetical protein
MKKLHTKFPLILLTLLNCTPYVHTTNKSDTTQRTDTPVNDEAAAVQSATALITDLSNAATDAEALINDFINSQVPETFESLFHAFFSKISAQKSNEKELYSLLSQLPLSPSIRIKESPFDVEEFEKQLPANFEIKENSIVEITSPDKQFTAEVPLAFFMTLGCDKLFRATINPEHHILFLHFENNQLPDLSFVGLINTKTLVSMLIPCTPEKEIKTIGICSDCTHLGIIRTDDSLLSYDLPTDLVTFSPSLKQKAFISYVEAQVNILNHRVAQHDNIIKAYAHLPLKTVSNLALFIESNKDLLPKSLYDAVYVGKLNTLQHILAVATNAQFIADTLNLDIDTLADKIVSNEITQEQIAAILSPEVSAQ